MTSWFPLLGAPAAWTLQLVLVWLVAEWTCAHDAPTRGIALAVSAVALLVALAALAGGAAAWRRSGNRSIADVHGATRPDFAAASALFVSAVFVLAVVATGASAFLLSCEAMR